MALIRNKQERLLWGKELAVEGPKKQWMSKRAKRLLSLLFQLSLFVFWGFMLWQGFVEGYFDIADAKGFGISVLYILMATVILLNVFKFLKQRETINPNTGLPIWLSQKRLAYISDDFPSGETVQIADIQSVHLNYIEGSIGLSLRTTAKAFNLLSSDAENLLRHILSIRPDLEPTS